MTRPEIKAIALRLAERDGLINLSRAELCKEAKIPEGSLNRVLDCTLAAFIEELRLENPKQPYKKVMKSRTNPALREAHILTTAVQLAEKGTPYNKVTRLQVAEAAGVSEALVSQYFGTMKQLKNAIMRRAVVDRILPIIGHGMVNKHPQALKAPHHIRRQAIALVMGA